MITEMMFLIAVIIVASTSTIPSSRCQLRELHAYEAPSLRFSFELPEYPIEFRHYGPSIWATAQGNDSYSYDILFNYITGGKEPGADFLMTTPVLYDFGRDISMFYIPKRLLDENLQPINITDSGYDINVERWEGRSFAILKYSGFALGSVIQEATLALEKILDENFSNFLTYKKGTQISAEFTDPREQQHRLNEVWFPVGFVDKNAACATFARLQAKYLKC
ncbi:hypothetical protein ACOME3_009687 [Neoechinorhynchus agilis]